MLLKMTLNWNTMFKWTMRFCTYSCKTSNYNIFGYRIKISFATFFLLLNLMSAVRSVTGGGGWECPVRGWARHSQVLLSTLPRTPSPSQVSSARRLSSNSKLQLQMADRSGGSGEEGKVSSNVARVSPVAMVAPTSPTSPATENNSKLSPPPSYKVAVYESHKVEQDSRETWDKKIEFLLAVVGFAVDLGNVSETLLCIFL